jgi:hypothetical protein
VSINTDSLPPLTRAKVAAVMPMARGPRRPDEWRAFRRRMAEIQANLAIEAMPLTEDELAFFDFAFGLNPPQREQDDLVSVWNRERVAAPAPVAAE